MAAPSLHDLWRQHIARLDAADPNRRALAPLAIAAEPAPPRLDLADDYDVAAAIESSLESSRRADGWPAQRQRDFCDLVAAGATVECAARAQGLSAASAYSFRNSAKGAAFAIGWTAAQLLQRQRLADAVAARAFEGQTVTVTRPDGSTHERHFFDNRLAMSVLTRLDRLAAGQIAPGTPDTSGAGQAARLAAAEFHRFLDVLGTEGAGPARAGLFLAARALGKVPGAPELAAIGTLARADLYARTGAGVAAEIAVGDLDPAGRAGWTADQWARAEAAGLLVLAPAPAPDGTSQDCQDWPDGEGADEDAVWWDDGAREYRTSLPCADGEEPAFESGEFGEDGYQRGLTPEEEAAVAAAGEETLGEERAAGLARRARWLARLRDEAVGEGRGEGVADAVPPADRAVASPPPLRPATAPPICDPLQSQIDGYPALRLDPSFPAAHGTARVDSRPRPHEGSIPWPPPAPSSSSTPTRASASSPPTTATPTPLSTSPPSNAPA